MKRTKFQRVLCMLLSATLLLGMFGIGTSAAGRKPDTGVQNALDEMKAYLNASSYAAYYEKYHTGDTSGEGLTSIDVDVVADLIDGSAVKVIDSDACRAAHLNSPSAWGAFGDFDTVGASSVYLPATGSATWQFTVEKEGLYYIRFEFYDCDTDESSISSIERKLLIDGDIPFTEATSLKMSKNWKFDNTKVMTAAEYEASADTFLPDGLSYAQSDAGYVRRYVYTKDGVRMAEISTISQDINGNSMSPDAVQAAKWNTYYCSDSTGYTQGYFEFYFSAGAVGGETHTLTLQAEREPMILGGITLVPVNDAAVRIKSYAEVLEEYRNAGYTTAGGNITTIQAEFPDLVSDGSVYATNDNSSSATWPSTAKAQLYNVIGENSYSTVGQWAAYKFTVDSTGLYKIGMRYLQSALQGMFICRTVKLSGGTYGLADGTPTVPFAEAYNTRFNYNKDWQSSYLGDGTSTFEFYFEEGVEYTLYLECSLGSLKTLISRAETSMNNINSAYLRILQLTGADPDEYRNYQFEQVMPDVLVTLLDEARELSLIADEFEALCGNEKGSHIATLDTIAILLDRMGSDNGYEIARNLSNLKSNLGTLGTWINNSKKSSMTVDCITVTPQHADDSALPRGKAGFFSSLWFEIKSFFCSFFTDYDSMGLTKKPEKDARTIDVWLATGRDQSKIWRSMIDIEGEGGFTSTTGVAVTLKLVTAGTLLPSILAGKGPDVYLGLASADVINYAIREAVLGINGADTRLSEADNKYFTSTYYTYYDEASGTYTTTDVKDSTKNATFVSKPYDEAVTVYDPATGKGNYVQAALDTVELLKVTYGIPMTMSFSMMFYRADVLAGLNLEIPETWSELLAALPVLQANNMSVGVSYEAAINFLLYQMGGNMWRYTDDPTGEYAGARIGLDTNEAYQAFNFVCRLYTDYSFPVTYDAANRFRTGEMPILVGDYATIYNQLIVFATEVDGLWEFCSLPGWVRTNADGTETYNYDSLAGVTATVLLYGCEDVLAAWEFMQWQTDAERQADYGNKMVALIGPSAKYESANVQAIKNLSWSASELAAITDQINHMSSIVNYPGSYIIARYTKFAFLDAKNNGTPPTDALRKYIDAINSEVKRKREEFELPTLENGEEPDYLKNK